MGAGDIPRPTLFFNDVLRCDASLSHRIILHIFKKLVDVFLEQAR